MEGHCPLKIPITDLLILPQNDQWNIFQCKNRKQRSVIFTHFMHLFKNNSHEQLNSQARILCRVSLQLQTSEIRVRVQTPRKENDYNAYSLY